MRSFDPPASYSAIHRDGTVGQHPWLQTSFYGVGIPYRYMMPPPHIIAMPHEPIANIDAERVAKVFLLSRIIRIFTFLDILFMTLFGLFQNIFFAGVVFAFCGYCGAKGYHKFLTAVYGLYLLAVAGLRIYYAATFFTDTALAPIVITALGVAVDVYIAYLIFMFLYLLNKLTPEEKEALSVMEEPPLLYMFYQSRAQPGRSPLSEPRGPNYGTGGSPTIITAPSRNMNTTCAECARISQSCPECLRGVPVDPHPGEHPGASP